MVLFRPLPGVREANSRTQHERSASSNDNWYAIVTVKDVTILFHADCWYFWCMFVFFFIFNLNVFKDIQQTNK